MGEWVWPARVMSLGLAGLMALALVACGGNGLEGAPGDREVPTLQRGEPEERLTIANWPLYIDPGERGTIAEFERESGVSVDYNEEVNDNQSFFARLQPELDRGQSGGRDILVVSDWMAAKMHDLGYLQEFDLSELPNVERNLVPALRNPPFDPDRRFTVPYQSGMTGLIVRKDQAPDVDEIADAFDPKYRGKVTLLSEMRDTVPLVMKMQGKDPSAPKEDWLVAVDFIEQQVADDQIRRFTAGDYARDLIKGDSWISFGWSGDAVQLQADNPDIEFVMPGEGCILWSDNMVIPVGAPNPNAALEFMNYVYDPRVQADIAAWVNYVTPVQGTMEVLADRDPELARNELIFPSPEFIEDCAAERFLEPEEEREITDAFQRVTAG